MVPVTRLRDLCLIALFKQLPPADQMTARTVCRRWADLVPYAARSTRSLGIFIGNQVMDDFEDQLLEDAIGLNLVTWLLKKEDGSRMFPQAHFSKWNALLYRGEDEPDEATMEAIAGTFVNLDTLQIGLKNVSPTQIDCITYLLRLYRHQLSTLNLNEDNLKRDLEKIDSAQSQYDSGLHLLVAINGLFSLKHLTLYLKTLPFLDLPIISQLEQLQVYWHCCAPEFFIDMLQEHISRSNTSLECIEYLCSDAEDDVEQFTILDDHISSRFTRLGIHAFPLTLNAELIGAHFRNLTTLNIKAGDTTLRWLFSHLTQLTKLIYLELDIDFATIQPDDQPHLLLPQIKSVQALQLGMKIRSHHELDQLNIAQMLPLLHSLAFHFWFHSQCTDCGLERFDDEYIQANRDTAMTCYRLMLLKLKHNCVHLQTLLSDHHEIVGSPAELLAIE